MRTRKSRPKHVAKITCNKVFQNVFKGAMSPVAHALASENKLEKDGPSFVERAMRISSKL